MTKLLKIFGVLAVLVVIALVGLNVFIKSYLTNDRIKALVIPPAEKALNRKVTIGDIGVSLFSGITIKDFTIKERDGKTDFVHSKAFKISYDLMPLLQKKLEVSEILLDAPAIRVVRDKDGKFNFNSLPKSAKSQESDEANKSAAVALPIALSVDRIRISNAQITFRDAKKELPDTDITADLTLKVGIGRDFDLTKLDFQGHLQAQVDALYGKIKPQMKITADFDPLKLTYNVETRLDQEQVVLAGMVENYMAEPAILLNITSKKLNLDYLAALGAALPQDGKSTPKVSKKPKTTGAKTAIAKSLPPGLYVHGEIKIDKALYKKLTINDFILPYELKDGVLTIKGLTAGTAGGEMQSDLSFDLRKPEPVYRGNIQMQAVKIDTLGQGLEQSFAEMINGQLKSNLNFDGAGFDLEQIKKTLSAKADYALSDGRIEKSKLSETISALIGLPELETISFKELSGNVKVKNGKIFLNSTLNNDDLAVSTNGGSVDMAGNLNMPVLIKISAALAKKINGGELGEMLTDGQGDTNLNLKIGGSYDQPKVSLDTKFLKKQVQKAVEKKVMNQIDKVINGNNSKGNDSARQLLQGIFGQ